MSAVPQTSRQFGRPTYVQSKRKKCEAKKYTLLFLILKIGFMTIKIEVSPNLSISLVLNFHIIQPGTYSCGNFILKCSCVLLVISDILTNERTLWSPHAGLEGYILRMHEYYSHLVLLEITMKNYSLGPTFICPIHFQKTYSLMEQEAFDKNKTKQKKQ